MAEGTSLLRKHMGLNLYREFESHRLRQKQENARASGRFCFRSLFQCPQDIAIYGDEQANSLACECDSKGCACKRSSGLQHAGESHRLRQK